MKICTKCKVEKDLDAFSPDHRNRDGRQTACKPCRNATARKVKHEPCMVGQKMCTKCDTKKAIVEFHHDCYKSDGRQPVCKPCVNARVQEYLQEPKHCEAARLRAGHYYRKNRESCRKRAYEFRQRNADQLKVIRKRQYWKDPENARLRATQWAKENPDKVAVIQARRRARKKNAVPMWESDADINRKAVTHQIAAWLRNRGDDVHVDHIVPLSRSGLDTYTNLRIISGRENFEKNARMPTEEELETVNILEKSRG